MIFHPSMIRASLRGRKRKTRRPAHLMSRIATNAAGQKVALGPDGKTRFTQYALLTMQPGRGKKGVAQIRVEDLGLERLREMTEEEAKAEGFDSLDAFFAMWIEIYGPTSLYEWVYVVTYRVERRLPGHEEYL